jgi:hypothetical protein
MIICFVFTSHSNADLPLSIKTPPEAIDDKSAAAAATLNARIAVEEDVYKEDSSEEDVSEEDVSEEDVSEEDGSEEDGSEEDGSVETHARKILLRLRMQRKLKWTKIGKK